MKKFLTALVVFSMLLSVLSMGVSAEKTCQEVTIPKFAAMPTFDGVISVEEWGEPTVHMVTDGASTVDDNTVGGNEELGLLNTFYWFEFEDQEMSQNFYYDLWMRWDEQYFYIAAKVNDPNPFSQVDLWTGDAFQFVVDVQGPSSNLLSKYPDFDYKTDPFVVTYITPWSSKNVFKCLASLVKGRTPTLWRAAGDWNIEKEVGGFIGITTTPNEDGMTCTNCYEVAVPWSVVAAPDAKLTSIVEDFVPKAGDVYGAAAVVTCTDSNVLYGWLQWGHGICYVDEKTSQPRGTRGGAQAMTLGSEEITPAAGYETAEVTTEPVVTEDENKVTLNRVTTVVTEADTATKTVANTAVVIKDNGDIISIVIIAVAVVALAAVVVIVVRRKKK